MKKVIIMFFMDIIMPPDMSIPDIPSMPDIAVELAMPPDMVMEPWDIPVMVEEGAAVVDIVMPDIEDMSMLAVFSAPNVGFKDGGLVVGGNRRAETRFEKCFPEVEYALLFDVRCRELWGDVRRSAEWKRCRPFNAVDVDGNSKRSFEMSELAKTRSTESAQSSRKLARCHAGCITHCSTAAHPRRRRRWKARNHVKGIHSQTCSKVLAFMSILAKASISRCASLLDSASDFMPI